MGPRTQFIFEIVIYLFFSERGQEGERGEKHRCERDIDHLLLIHAPLTGNGTHNPGMCPDWESNRRPFALWDNA